MYGKNITTQIWNRTNANFTYICSPWYQIKKIQPAITKDCARMELFLYFPDSAITEWEIIINLKDPSTITVMNDLYANAAVSILVSHEHQSIITYS